MWHMSIILELGRLRLEKNEGKVGEKEGSQEEEERRNTHLDY